jgi:hypothetical protein
MSRIFTSVVVLGTVLGFLVTSSVPAADKPPNKPPSAGVKDGHPHHGGKAAPKGKLWQPAQPLPPGGNEAVIEKALGRPAQLDFTDYPLTDAVDYLKDYYSKVLGNPFEIQLDTKALNDAGIAPDTPVTKRLNGISLRSALDLLLHDLQLTWIIDHEVLLITTPEEAENRLTTKVLDVSDLVVCRDSKGKSWEDYDRLIAAIKSTVMPTTWDDVGGPGSMAPGDFGTARALIVSQTQRVHGKIAAMLAELRAVAKKTPDLGPPVREKDAPIHHMGRLSGVRTPPSGTSPKEGTKGGGRDDKGKSKSR